jgi:iron(III) transport system ATP-binding protein
MDFLTVSGINKKGEKDFVLQDINLTLPQFKKIAIAGETGSGKSSLLKIIAGLVQPDTGIVRFKNEKVWGPDYKLIPGHTGIAYLSQHYELLNNYRVEELLSYANELLAEEAEALYKICRIDHLLHRRTNQLSGGEKQRIAMARLITTSPELFLLDEPFSNLDVIHKNILKSVIHDLGEKLNITFIIVSHDPLDTLSWADEIIVLKEGWIIQQTSPQQIYNYPINEYVAGLFGNYNLLSTPLRQHLGINHATNNKSLFVRPENFITTTNESNALKGVINKITFFGSTYEIEVLLSENIVTIETAECNYTKGDSIYLSISPSKELWYI